DAHDARSGALQILGVIEIAHQDVALFQSCALEWDDRDAVRILVAHLRPGGWNDAGAQHRRLLERVEKARGRMASRARAAQAKHAGKRERLGNDWFAMVHDALLSRTGAAASNRTSAAESPIQSMSDGTLGQLAPSVRARFSAARSTRSAARERA